MKRLLLLATLLAVNAIPGFAQASIPTPETVSAKMQRTYKKVGERELKIFVNLPPGWKHADKRPAIVWFHGGGWVSGTPTQFDEHSRYFASRGLVCFQVEYRLLNKKGNAPPIDCIQDARSSMRWVRAHALEWGVDPQRLAAGGGSAGGHLAAFVGLVQGTDDPQDTLAVSSKANALLLFNPVLDNGPEGGWGMARVGERYGEFSPAHNVKPGAPPAVVFLGTNDKLIPVSTINRFQSNMEKAGARCEVHFYEGAGHGFFNAQPYRKQTLIEADKFLASLGWIQGDPTLN